MFYYKTEKYVVLYGSDFYDKYNKAEFASVDRAIKYALNKLEEGYDVIIKQVNLVKDWEHYLHADVKLTEDDIDDNKEEFYKYAKTHLSSAYGQMATRPLVD